MALSNLKSLSNVVERRKYVGTNSATIAAGDLVTLSGGFVVKAGAAAKIEGIAEQSKTFASDNQTVAKAELQVVLPRKGQTFVLACSSASLAQADVGSFFDLTSAQDVDYATKTAYASYIDTTSASAADALVKKQVRLVKYVGRNTSEYEIVTID